MTLTDLRRDITELIEQTYGTAAALASFDVTYSAEARFGDFAVNAAMVLAKALGRSPREIAEELAPKLQAALDGVDKAEVAGPGFLNLTMNQMFWIKQLAEITPDYARSSEGRGKKVQVEFISANPTGPLTLANARGGFLGDVLSNVLAWNEWEVTREHYLNDAGGQIGKLVQSIKHEAGLPTEGELQYQGSYIKEVAEQIKPTADTSDEEIGAQAVAVIVEMIKAAVKRMGVEFDVWFSEQSLLDDGVVAAVLSELETRDLIYEADGARWLASSRYGDTRDRVVIKSSGESIYLLNDLAYHYNIFKIRKFDRAIKIWGADHGGQVASLKLTVGQLVPQAELDFILLQLVHIIKDGKEFKSSKRAGTYITMDELIDEVGSAEAARWFFLSRSADTQMDFDLDLAAETSAKNPYYYVMYAYARANSILAKAKDKGIEAADKADRLTEPELALAKQMARLPEVVREIAVDFSVHRLTFFGLELAKLFTAYYESTRIIDLPVPEAAGRLYVVQRFVTFMNVYWSLMGITPMTRMERADESE